MSQEANAPLTNRLDMITKVLALIVTLGYVSGFVLINILCYSIWGFTDFTITVQQCLVFALGVSIFCILSCILLQLPIWIAKEIIPKLVPEFVCNLALMLIRKLKDEWESASLKWPPFFGTLAAICPVLVFGLAIFIYVGPIIFARQIHDFMTKHALNAGDHRICIMWVTCFLIATAAMSFLVSAWKQRKTLNKISRLDIAVVGLFSVIATVCFTLCFALCPPSLGGLNPHHQEFWVSRSALSVLAACNTDADLALKVFVEQPGAPDLGAFNVRDMYVLHESSDRFILWSGRCPSDHLEVSKDLVKAVK